MKKLTDKLTYVRTIIKCKLTTILYFFSVSVNLRKVQSSTGSEEKSTISYIPIPMPIDANKVA